MLSSQVFQTLAYVLKPSLDLAAFAPNEKVDAIMLRL